MEVISTVNIYRLVNSRRKLLPFNHIPLIILTSIKQSQESNKVWAGDRYVIAIDRNDARKKEICKKWRSFVQSVGYDGYK